MKLKKDPTMADVLFSRVGFACRGGWKLQPCRYSARPQIVPNRIFSACPSDDAGYQIREKSMENKKMLMVAIIIEPVELLVERM